MTNSIEVIKPFVKALEADHISNVQIFGGVNSAALLNPKTEFDVDNREIHTPSSLYLDTHRDDATHSLRDLDVLVLSSSRQQIENIQFYVKQTVGNQLESSVFGIRTAEALKRQTDRPFGLVALRTFLSDRYDNPDKSGLVKSIFPFSVDIDPESVKTWTLLVGDSKIPVPNPSLAVANYACRSISGIRPKDLAKVEALADNIFTRSPELRDWAIDGPGKSQVDLGLMLRSLNPNKNHPDIFNLGRPIVPLFDLIDSDAFIPKDLKMEKQKRILAITALKAQGLSFLESNPLLVAFFQKFVERQSLISAIVNNE